jgi:hypothetical protein
MAFVGIDAVTWTAIGTLALAVATIFLAVATIALAWFGFKTFQSNKELIEATVEDARASTEMVAEVRRDRDLEVQPFLVFEHPVFSEITTEKLRGIRNVGRGPALACSYLIACPCHKENSPATCYGRGSAFNLGPGQTTEGLNRAVPSGPVIEMEVVDAEAPGVQTAFSGLQVPEGDGPCLEIVLCQDQFRRRYRFVRGQLLPDIVTPGEVGSGHWAQYWYRES